MDDDDGVTWLIISCMYMYMMQHAPSFRRVIWILIFGFTCNEFGRKIFNLQGVSKDREKKDISLFIFIYIYKIIMEDRFWFRPTYTADMKAEGESRAAREARWSTFKEATSWGERSHAAKQRRRAPQQIFTPGTHRIICIEVQKKVASRWGLTVMQEGEGERPGSPHVPTEWAPPTLQ